MNEEQARYNLEVVVPALRSGKYLQGKTRLHRDTTFCCLGVICNEENPFIWENVPEREEYITYRWGNNSTTSLPFSLQNKTGLTGSGEAYVVTQAMEILFPGLPAAFSAIGSTISLIAMNDSDSQYNFYQIADVLALASQIALGVVKL